MIGRLHGIVLDCPDPDSLATFYAELLGMVRVQDEEDWVVIGDAADRPGLAFARVPDYRADLAARRPAAVPALRRTRRRPRRRRGGGAGARSDPAVRRRGRFRVFADPVGHPFCLILT